MHDQPLGTKSGPPLNTQEEKRVTSRREGVRCIDKPMASGSGSHVFGQGKDDVNLIRRTHHYNSFHHGVLRLPEAEHNKVAQQHKLLQDAQLTTIEGEEGGMVDIQLRQDSPVAQALAG